MVVRLHWRSKWKRSRWHALLQRSPPRASATIVDPEMERRKILRQIPTMNVVIKNEHFDPELVEVFFFEDDEIQFLPTETDMAEIAWRLGLFPSKTAARKQGWAGEIPPGWTDRRGLGKLRKNLFIWNPMPFDLTLRDSSDTILP